MSNEKKAVSAVESTALISTIVHGFFRKIFEGRPFLDCLTEYSKNSRDWNATLIEFITEDSNVLQIIDNGRGMDAENRNAFVSLNDSTTSEDQSGEFGTGSKYLIFSFGKSVVVDTAPKDDPDHVWRFAFTADELELTLAGKQEIYPQRMKKTKKIWPYDFEFGTKIELTYANPKRKAIRRGTTLAKELSSRLMSKFQHIVKVDGEYIPEKEILGEWFSVTDRSSNHLGEVTMELYVPKKRNKDDQLYLTGFETGESVIVEFARHVVGIRDGVPDVYLRPEIAGTISANMFATYANEDRKTLNASISDDPITPHMLRLLDRHAPEIERRLKLRQETYSKESNAEITELARTLQGVYGVVPGADTGAGIEDDSGGAREDDSSHDVPGIGSDKSGPMLKLRHDRNEYSIGETIDITATLRGSVKGREDRLQWYVDSANATIVSRNPGSLTLEATELGRGMVQVDIPGTSHVARVRYDVVQKRSPRLNVGQAKVEAGAELRFRVLNADLLKGTPLWSHSGGGKMTRSGQDAVIFKATRPTEAQISFTDSHNSRVRDTCLITVVPSSVLDDDVIPIRGRLFKYAVYDAESDQYSQPATMTIGDGKVHRIVFNKAAPGYREAQREGNLDEFLRHAVAQQFPRFMAFEIEKRRVDPRDTRSFDSEMTSDGYVIYQEMVSKSFKAQ